MGDKEKRAEDIIEETMQEIYNDLNKSNAFKETDDDYEDSQEKETHREDADSLDLPYDDNTLESDEFHEAGDGESDTDHEAAEEENEEETDDGETGAEEIDDDEDEPEGQEYEMDEEEEESNEKKALRKKKRKKIALIVCGSILGVIFLVYAGFAVYFNSHFLFFTEINGTDYSLKSVSQVEKHMEELVADYVLTLQESDGGSETISGADISLEYVPGEQLEQLVKEQNNLLWPVSLWENPEIKAKVGVKYNEEALEGIVGSLNCMAEENQTAPVDAHPEFQGESFVVVPEVLGSQIDVEQFNKAVAEAINGFIPTLDMEAEDCYVLPRYVSDSPEVIAATDAMNSYLGANVTYDFNPYTEIVDASVIAQWVIVDGDMNVAFDEAAVKAFVQLLADKYDTKGKPRTFVTATGNTVTIEGGGYGWKIDQEAEYNALIANIQNAETVTREPVYSSRAASHEGNDMGSTYAEVDLSNQQMYFIQNGQVVLESPIVTGNPNKGNGTPQGVYSLAYKALDQVLRGTRQPDGSYEYETPVRFWMPFNGGIGFHDATWQSSFGGSRYLSYGSHGCINLPYDIAAQLYDLISAGTPVVCHY